MLALIPAAGLIVLALLPGRWDRPSMALWAVPLNLGVLVLLSVEVFGEDTYYLNADRSRWATGSGADHILYIALAGVVAVASAAFVLLAARRSRGWVVRQSLLLNGTLDLILGGLVFATYATT